MCTPPQGSPHTPGATPNVLSHLPTTAAPSSESHTYLSQTTHPTPTAPHVTNRPRPANNYSHSSPPPMRSKRLLPLIIPEAAMPVPVAQPCSILPKSRALEGELETSMGYPRGKGGSQQTRLVHFRGMAPALLVHWGTQPPGPPKEPPGSWLSIPQELKAS